jgi:type IV pilus assembly protein PilX
MERSKMRIKTSVTRRSSNIRGTRLSNKQHGVALVVVMIFIVALTSIAILSSRNVSLSERVARNQLDAQVAREAAEAALRDAEFDLLLTSEALRTGAKCARTGLRPVSENISQFTGTCSKGQCGLPQSRYDTSNHATATATSNTGEPWWEAAKGGLWNDTLSTKPTVVGANCNFSGGVPYGTYSGRAELVGVSRQPEYLIEYFRIGTNNLFRINARGFGRNPNTEIVLQSYFRPFQ